MFLVRNTTFRTRRVYIYLDLNLNKKQNNALIVVILLIRMKGDRVFQIFLF